MLRNIFIFLILISPTFSFMDGGVNVSIVIGVGGFFYIVAKGEIGRELAYLLCVLVLSFSVLFLIILGSSSHFTEINHIFAFAVISVFNSYLLALMYKNRSLHSIVFHMSLLLCLNVLISLVFFMVPDVVGVLKQVLIIGNEEIFSASKSGRSPGLSGIGGAALSALYAFVFVMLLGNWKRYNKAYLTGILALLLIGIGIAGRTGFLIILIYLTYYLFKGVLRLDYRFLLGTGAVVIMLSSLVLYVEQFQKTDGPFAHAVYHALEPLRRFRVEGRIRTDSSDAIMNKHYFLPKETGDILLGIGNFGRSPDLIRLPSDVAYVRMIHGVGIVGMFAMLVPYLFMVLRSYLSHHDKEKSKGFYVALFITILVGFKEWFYLGLPGVTLLLTSFYFMSFNGKRIHNY